MTTLRDSEIWASTCTLKAQVLANARGPMLVRPLVSAGVLVVLGAALVGFVPWPLVGWTVLVFGLLTAARALSGARRPGRLMLEADGFTYRGLAGRVISRQWTDCGEFRAAGLPFGGPAYVVWTGPDGGRGGAFLPGAAALPAADLAVLLNRYRLRYAV